MSGHSKWSTIKRKKGVQDAKRGQLFTKLGREIEIAARDGGGDPSANFRLRLVIDKARQANMPKENIERAIKRGTGELKGAALEEVRYEGYGPEGTAFIVQVVTDNRNRAVADVRRIFTRHGGNLGETGCVAWLFDHRGYFSIDAGDDDPEAIALDAIDAGAEDVRVDNSLVEVFTTVDKFKSVKEELERRNIKYDSAELAYIPKTMVRLDEKGTMQNMRLIDALEELEDVQSVFSNLEIPDDIMEKYEAAA